MAVRAAREKRHPIPGDTRPGLREWRLGGAGHGPACASRAWAVRPRPGLREERAPQDRNLACA
ncbi:hypothetical protein [Streptomyces sp. NPDC091416]|uniref:hypothetical protein n=1 Tax=Streptomyces sp. NPDC091416 TaxID=3366003 RepID=UPI00380FA5B4